MNHSTRSWWCQTSNESNFIVSLRPSLFVKLDSHVLLQLNISTEIPNCGKIIYTYRCNILLVDFPWSFRIRHRHRSWKAARGLRGFGNGTNSARSHIWRTDESWRCVPHGIVMRPVESCRIDPWPVVVLWVAPKFLFSLPESSESSEFGSENSIEFGIQLLPPTVEASRGETWVTRKLHHQEWGLNQHGDSNGLQYSTRKKKIRKVHYHELNSGILLFCLGITKKGSI